MANIAWDQAVARAVKAVDKVLAEARNDVKETSAEYIVDELQDDVPAALHKLSTVQPRKGDGDE